MLAGDAAHLMPVWQGQGYNSGIRDAANLGWKLAAVVNGQAGDALLDTYDVERRKHARAMIDLSTMVGRVISPTNRRVAALRDRVIHARVGGALAEALCAGDAVQADAALRSGRGLPRRAAGRQNSPTGTLFIQPRVDTRDQQNVLLDDVIGSRLRRAVLEQQPARSSRRQAFDRWKALGASVHRRPADDPAALDRPRRPRRRGRR